MSLSKEATLKEVLPEVTLADVADGMKQLIKSMGCYGVVLAIVFVADQVGGSGGFTGTWHIPTIAWIAIVVWFVVLGVTWERSYHEWKGSFWFPKLRLFGSLAVAAYITAIIEAQRLIDRPPHGLEPAALWGVLFVFGIWPGLIFFVLCQVGHERLIAKREAALSSERDGSAASANDPWWGDEMS